MGHLALSASLEAMQLEKRAGHAPQTLWSESLQVGVQGLWLQFQGEWQDSGPWRLGQGKGL